MRAQNPITTKVNIYIYQHFSITIIQDLFGAYSVFLFDVKNEQPDYEAQTWPIWGEKQPKKIKMKEGK